MPWIPKDLTGKKFARLLALRISHTEKVKKGSKIYWVFRCDCGAEKTLFGLDVTSGNTKSCGCFRREVSGQRATNHGQWTTKIWRKWQQMRGRVLNPKNHKYPRYGGRGITIDPRWDKFENFLDDMGESYEKHVAEFGEKDTTLERENNDGNYEPGNVRWATLKEQANNKRNSRRFLYNGKECTYEELSVLSGHSVKTLHTRLQRLKWVVERAVSTPIRTRNLVKP